ncbi:MAG TPA: MgtC/SapB family protein [bacterium]|nr:MgtC/SapB family protein [bacterium]
MPLTLDHVNVEFLLFMERVAISLGIGMMIGLEREWAHKDIGVRTFSIVSLAFTLAWGVSPTASYILMVGIFPLITLVNWRSFVRDRSLEMTTSVALLATAILGILVGEGQLLVATACGVVMTALLAWKSEVVRFAGEVTIDEIRGAIILGLMAVVVYQLLPAGPIDPWHLIDLRAAWTVVLVISAIAFANYILLRIYGTRGIRWTGLLGGLVNSTATVAELASRARTDPGRLSTFALMGMLTANSAMLIRNGLILGIFASQALAFGWISVVLMLLMSLAAGSRINIKDSETAPLHIKSPISIRYALTFGGLFVIITLAGQLANRAFPQTGFLIVSVLGGLVSSASTSAAAGILAAKGTLPPELAGYGVVLTSMASLAFHIPMAQMAGRDRSITHRLARLSALILAAGLAGLAAQVFLLPHHV